MSWPAHTSPFTCAGEPEIPSPPEPGPTHETNKPILLVDVDGVLNCFGSLWSPEYEAEHFEPTRSYHNQFTIRVRKGTAGRLARLAEHFEMTWGTAWCEQAHPFFGEWLQLGEPWPHLNWTSAWIREGASWKLPDIQRFAEERPTRPLAWIDDDIQGDAYQWAEERVKAGTPTLVVRTNPVDGLQDKHVEQLVFFAETTQEVAR